MSRDFRRFIFSYSLLLLRVNKTIWPTHILLYHKIRLQYEYIIFKTLSLQLMNNYINGAYTFISRKSRNRIKRFRKNQFLAKIFCLTSKISANLTEFKFGILRWNPTKFIEYLLLEQKF